MAEGYSSFHQTAELINCNPITSCSWASCSGLNIGV